MALLSEAGDHPGRFVVGPEEKYGVAGRFAGFGCVVIAISHNLCCRPLGDSDPVRDLAQKADTSQQPETMIAEISYYKLTF